ncbi:MULTISPECIES: peptidoglycan-binding domain-containing protein [Actinocorallia]|uniref:N-acetylmuramoyl-L-alanine amidase n=2 Tax=Actinocorallia TaxID=58108 RepID=A0ABN3USE7_9ACTN
MTLTLITRTQWGARKARQSASYLTSTRGVKVHYTGSYVDPALADDHDRCAALVRQIQNNHMDANGWNDIGYSFICCPHRYVYEGRGLHRLPAANGEGLNTGHYAILGLVGNKGLTQPSEDMLHGIRDAIDHVRAKGGAGKEVKGHRDGYATDCPGPKLYAWVQDGAPRPGASAGEPAPSTDAAKAPRYPGRPLVRNSRGKAVATWQHRMRQRGWNIAVDAHFGPKSEAVAKAFQKEKHLAVDGMVGKKTWAATWEEPIT